MNTNLNYYKWKNEFIKLDSEINSLREKFLQNKNCRCTSVECIHFKEMRKRIFGNRINELYNQRLNIGFEVFSEITNHN